MTKAFERDLRGALLGLALAASFAATERLPGDLDFHDEAAVGRIRLVFYGHIFGRFVPACLSEVLERTLGIGARSFADCLVDFLAEETPDEGCSRCEPGIEVDGPDDRFEGSGKVSVAGPPTGCLLAAAEHQELPKADTGGGPREGGAPDDFCSGTGQFTFAGVGAALEEQPRDDEPEDSVAKEFQSFVGGIGRRVFVEV